MSEGIVLENEDFHLTLYHLSFCGPGGNAGVFFAERRGMVESGSQDLFPLEL